MAPQLGHQLLGVSGDDNIPLVGGAMLDMAPV